MTETVDLDKEFPWANATPVNQPSTTITMFGREWNLMSSVNNFTFTRMAGGSTQALGEFIVNAVVPEERTDWERAISGVVDLGADELIALITRLAELVGNDDTKSSSGSRSSASKRTSARKSTAVSSSGRAVERKT